MGFLNDFPALYCLTPDRDFFFKAILCICLFTINITLMQITFVFTNGTVVQKTRNSSKVIKN